MAPELAIHSTLTGGVRVAVLKLAKAVGSQPAGLGEAPGGAAHGVAEGNPGGAPANMAAGWKGHMEMRPDHGLWKVGQGAPRGGVGAGVPPRPPPSPPPRPPPR